MTAFIANIDLAFKTLAPRATDWQSILPEIAVAGLALFCLVQAMLLPKALRYLIPDGCSLAALVSNHAGLPGRWAAPTAWETWPS